MSVHNVLFRTGLSTYTGPFATIRIRNRPNQFALRTETTRTHLDPPNINAY